MPHESNKVTCAQAVEVFLKTGSHFFAHASWGCKESRKAWLVVEVDSRDESRAIVPPDFRSQAKIVQLNAFTRGGDRGIPASIQTLAAPPIAAHPSRCTGRPGGAPVAGSLGLPDGLSVTFKTPVRAKTLEK